MFINLNFPHNSFSGRENAERMALDVDKEGVVVSLNMNRDEATIFFLSEVSTLHTQTL